MVIRRVVHQVLGATPMFSLVMTVLCILAAVFVVFMDLGTGALALWLFSAGIWFSLAVRAANTRGRTH